MAFNLSRARATFRLRQTEQRERGLRRAARLLGHLDQVRNLLVARFGVRRVFLFGSLVSGNATEWSDVDLAVEGLSSSFYFDALAEVTREMGARVDLVRIEEAPESLRDRILAEGRAL